MLWILSWILKGFFVNLFYLNIWEVLLKCRFVFYAIFSKLLKFITLLTIVLDKKYLLFSGFFLNFGKEHEFNLLLVQPKTQSPNQKVDKWLSFIFFLPQINDKELTSSLFIISIFFFYSEWWAFSFGCSTPLERNYKSWNAFSSGTYWNPRPFQSGQAWHRTRKSWTMGKKWYFVTKIFLTYREKKLFYWLRKIFERHDW